jgi:tetratricopeptide (TPR) repeat protein
MIHKKGVLIFFVMFCCGLYPVSAQNRPASSQEFLEIGLGLYSESRFTESVAIFRCILPGETLYPDALYWLSLAEITLRKYNDALKDMEALEKLKSRWDTEIHYNRGRCYFYLGEYEKALVNFGIYFEALKEDDLRRALSFYWMGESLFAMGRMDSAANAYALVIENYPFSIKYEAACYRLDLISQKKIEAELLALLKWSHEESIRSLEDYRARERIYEQAIAGQTRDSPGMRAEQTPGEMEAWIAAMEARRAEENAALEKAREGAVFQPSSDEKRDSRVQELLKDVRELFDTLNTLNKNLGGD